MADNETLTATPYAVHIPDTYSEQEKREGASWELGAGHYEFGFEVNGARFPLARLKGGGVQKRLAAAKAQRDTEGAASTSSTADATEQQPQQ
jgi:hypothetical protein